MATKETTRLSAALEARRVALRLQWDQIAEQAGMSVAHLRRIRKGDAVITPLMQAGLEDALRWQRGSIDDINRGEAPTPVGGEGLSTAKTLGDLLVERGLRTPEQLGLSDEIVNDPVAQEILDADEFDEGTRDKLLSVYANMRREIFDTVRNEKKKPRT